MPAPQTGQTPRAMGRPLALVVYVTRCIGWCSRQRAHHPISSPLRVSCASASESSDAAAGVECSAAPMSPFAVGGGASSGDPGEPGAAGGGASSGDPGEPGAAGGGASSGDSGAPGVTGSATAGTGCSAAPMSPFALGGGASSGDSGAPGVTGGATAGTGCSAAPMSPFALGGAVSSGDSGAPGAAGGDAAAGAGKGGVAGGVASSGDPGEPGAAGGGGAGEGGAAGGAAGGGAMGADAARCAAISADRRRVTSRHTSHRIATIAARRSRRPMGDNRRAGGRDRVDVRAVAGRVRRRQLRQTSRTISTAMSINKPEGTGTACHLSLSCSDCPLHRLRSVARLRTSSARSSPLGVSSTIGRPAKRSSFTSARNPSSPMHPSPIWVWRSTRLPNSFCESLR
jgi:hypothetical protein